MYGLLIENISQYIQERYGVEKWNEIRRLAQIEETSFNTHTIYPDVYTKNIIDKACQILKLSDKQFLIEVGESFVTFIGRYGYDVVLSALGREFSDFLNSLDDLHEYLRLSYPRLRPPSYFCDNENEFGLILHYRTKRNFLLWYTVGQIIKVAKVFYSTDVEIELLSENQEINEYHFILQLRFDNRVYLERHRNSLSELQPAPSRLSRLSLTSPLLATVVSGHCPFGPLGRHTFSNNSRSPSPSPPTSSLSANFPASVSTVSLDVSSTLSPITLEVFLDIFPFSIVYDSSMKICQTGNCLKVVCPNIISQNITNVFSLIKPKIEFTWDSILRHTNTTFELKMAILLKSQNKSRRIICELRNYMSTESEFVPSISNGGTCHQCPELDEECNKSDDVTVRCGCNSTTKSEASFLKLKGQMIYFDSWKCITFLGAPNVANLDTLIKTGLYLNDLSMHDFSRDMVLAGQQQSAELKLALDQELHKSRQLEITIKKLDEERRRSDQLLYQMIADKLRVGEKNIETCQYFPSITILFSDIINFTEICSKIAPMQVVNMLNETYTRFDQLTEKHNIYKVETIGDAYMVAGGLPVHQEESSYSHARKICQMAMDMIDSVYHIKDPSRGRHLKIRIGIHTGPVVGGIVGQKMPRYCLFGDTVNTSSRMETSSIKMKVQISEVTQKLLDPNEWDIRERGTVRLKGKGMMKTYWLSYRKERARPTEITNGNGTGDTMSDDRALPDCSTQRALFTLNNHHHHDSAGVHESNQSLFVSNRMKMSCHII